MKETSVSDILTRSVVEWLLFIENVNAAAPESVQLTEMQRQELDSRLAAYHKNPDAGSTWEEVKARILKS